MTDKANNHTSKTSLKTTKKPLAATGVALASEIDPSSSLGKSLRQYEAHQASLAKLINIDSPMLQLAKSMQNWNLSIGQQVAEAMRPALMASEAMQAIAQQALTATEMMSELAASFRPISDLMENLKPLNSSLVNLSSLQSSTRLSDYATRSLELQNLTIKRGQVEATSLASTEISLGGLKYVRTEVVSMSARLDTIETTNQQLLTGQQEIIAKLSRLDNLERLILSGQANLIPARIKSFTVTKDGSKLVINNQPINLDPNSMQAYLANTLFGSDKSASIKWHIEDIAQKFEGEAALDDIKGWNDKFYQAARSLNSKISIILATPTQAILYRQQEYWVNPELIDLIHS